MNYCILNKIIASINQGEIRKIIAAISANSVPINKKKFGNPDSIGYKYVDSIRKGVMYQNC